MHTSAPRHPAPSRHARAIARATAVAASWAAALAVSLLPFGAARAVEGGAPITPFGVNDFGAGILPPPADLPAVGLRATTYHANQLRDDQGRHAPLGADLTVTSVGVALIKMTRTTFWGAGYGFGAVLPRLDMKLDLSIPTPAGPLRQSGRQQGQGDIQLIPGALQWTAPGLFQYAALLVQAPTGSYDVARLINPGTNHWTISPTYAFTHIGAGGFEVSSSMQVNFSTRNRANGYRSGAEWQQEFAVGRHVGDFTVGLGGYVYHQLGGDRVHGVGVGNRAGVAALGPSLSFFRPGSGLPNIWLHAYKEFNGRNRSQGTQIAVRAAFVL